MESNFKCPLLNKEIDDGYCYDINMVISNIAKPSILDDKIDKEKAKCICEKCEFNQMK
jgi:hypothetical protein